IQIRLAETLSRRVSTFREDMAHIREVVKNARNPAGLLSVKLNEMEQGRFVAKGPVVVAASALASQSQSGEYCGDFRRGVCVRGERCRFSHGAS
ncbi:unnamed protein product, partial [Polarella glacialis]